MLEELVWVVLFGLVVAAATIIIKIAIEFPGFLRFKCMYKEDHTNAEDDFDEIVEVDVDRVMMFYEHEMRKSNKGSRNKSKVQVDHENNTEEAGDIVKKVHKHKHKLRDNKQIEKNVNEIEIDPIASSTDIIAYDIPPQVTIKLHKKICNDSKKVTDFGLKTVSAVIEHRESAPSIEISEAAHHKHGHVRQH